MQTTLDIDDNVLAAARDLATRRQEDVGKVLSDLARVSLVTGSSASAGKTLLTNAIIAEVEENELWEKAHGRPFRMPHAPVRLRSGRELPALTNQAAAELLVREEMEGTGR